MALPVTSGLILHLDASTGITKDGSDRVSQWADQSGAGNDFTQATAGNQPLWVAAGSEELGGNSVVNFYHDFLSCSNLDLLKSTSRTIFIVERDNDASDYYENALLQVNSSVSAVTFAMKRGYSLPNTYRYTTTEAVSLYGTEGKSLIQAESKDYVQVEVNRNAIMAARLRPYLGAELLETKEYYYGVPLISKTALVKWEAATISAYSISLGNLLVSDKDIAEVVIYDRSLDDAEMDQVGAYLNQKYNPNLGTIAATLSITGAAAGTIQRNISAAGAATFTFTGSGIGTIQREIVGEAAGTLSFSGSGLGFSQTIIHGTIAGSLVLFGGSTGVPVTFKYTSRAISESPERDKVSEALSAIVKCEFNDNRRLTVTLKTDIERYKTEIQYNDNEEVVNAQETAGRPYFRKFIDAIPPPGCFGSLHQVEVEKVLHGNGFEFTGFNLYTVPRPGIGPEFLAGNATLSNGWE